MNRLACGFFGVVLIVLGSAGLARADVVGPEPFFCGPGKVGVSDHDGSRCEEKPPTNCPSGWRGVIGGGCLVATCTSDGNCESGETCTDATVCIEKRQVFERRRSDGDAPEYYDAEVGICGAGASCNPPRGCEKRSVCVRRGEVATAYVPPPGQFEAKGLPRRPCCGGCAVGEEGGAAATFAIGAALLLTRATRRKYKEAARRSA